MHRPVYGAHPARKPAARRSSGRAARLFAFAAALVPAGVAAQDPLSLEELRAMTIDDLADLEVTTVAGRAEPISEAAAAVYVITSEDIRRLGATNLAEALRLAPNLHVVRLDALTHNIAARGFNSTNASNKLLVMVDGRTVYSPLHSGVFWDAQDLMLDDVDRIEVVSGPGGTLWGANAVNGIIHVITRSADATRGALVTASHGNADRDAALRYGFAAGETLAMRAYVKGFERGNSINPDGTYHVDDWNRVQGGFRADWRAGANELTLLGDLFETGFPEVSSLLPDAELSGADVLARWVHRFDGGSPLQVQAYFDRTYRNQAPILIERVHTWDLEARHTFTLARSHTFVWGGGYRIVDDYFANLGPVVVGSEDSRRTIGSVFVQDAVAASDDVTVTLGLKAEDHTYTGLEYMPNVRLSWRATESMLWWAAVSRAVRTPARVDRELELPGVVAPAPGFRSETLLAYEAGYRGQPFGATTLSVSLFYNDYDHLRTTELSPGGMLPAFLANGMEGATWGVELAANYAPLDWWRLSGGFTWLRKDLDLEPGVVDISEMEAAGNDPSHHARIRSLMTFFQRMELDVGARVIGELHAPEVPGYVQMDARVGWHVTDRLELSLTGFNLLEPRHAEGGPADERRSLRRTVNVGFDWRF